MNLSTGRGIEGFIGDTRAAHGVLKGSALENIVSMPVGGTRNPYTHPKRVLEPKAAQGTTLLCNSASLAEMPGACTQALDRIHHGAMQWLPQTHCLFSVLNYLTNIWFYKQKWTRPEACSSSCRTGTRLTWIPSSSVRALQQILNPTKPYHLSATQTAEHLQGSICRF